MARHGWAPSHRCAGVRGDGAARDAWRRFYGEAIDALTWPDLESRYRIGIGVDQGGAPTADVLARWSGRLLVLEGARDRVARRSVQVALRAAYPRARIHTFATAGHAAALETPDEWLDVVSAFFTGADASHSRSECRSSAAPCPER